MPGSIFLIGPMATGKTAVGRRLATLLGVRFIDTDAEVTSAHGSIADIFAHGGEAEFRVLESAALRAAADQHGSVVATGGGAVLEAANRELLAAEFTVYLETDVETVRERIVGATGRPLLEGDPLQRWRTIFAEREPYYRQCSTLTIDARVGTPAALAQIIGGAYRRRLTAPGGSTA